MPSPLGASVPPLGPMPAGVARPTTREDRALYEQAAQLEGVFVKQLVAEMLRSARGDEQAQGANGLLQDSADEAMTKALVDSGSFGLAGTIYGSLKLREAGPAPGPTAGGAA